MLDIRWLREHPREAVERMATRGKPTLLADAIVLDQERRAALAVIEPLRAEASRLSQEISRRLKGGEPTEETAARAREAATAVSERERHLRDLDARLEEVLHTLPNLPDSRVPPGTEETDNRVVRTRGEPSRTEWSRPHWEIGEALGILDFARAAAVAGSRFYFLTGDGAALQRALTGLMLRLAVERGATEIAPPLLAARDAMVGSGHLPKFEDDVFRTAEGPYLIPTGEVPLVNLHRSQVLDGSSLPRRYVAATPCFRKEVGAPGQETRGMIRVHQFEKVELVSFVRPEESDAELDRLVACAEAVLEELGIPYRTVELCAGELGFSAARTYDVEAWFPGIGRYLEVSSCSNCGDFQARRCGTRFRDGKSRPRFVHTLNASGLAVGRTLAAILENCQREDGSVALPPVLRPAFGGREALWAR